ncbi:MAG: EAL domain-containing protein [Fretibacterium sp.]|nr:EAL domain-containing protein [Fretibacterium sp.]
MDLDGIFKGNDFLNYAQYMPGGFFIYKAGGGEEILFANDNFMNLFDCSDFEEFMEYTGGSFHGLVHPDDLERVRRQIADQVIKSGDSFDYMQYRIQTKKGRIRYIEEFGCFVQNSGGVCLSHGGQCCSMNDGLFFVFAVDLCDKHYPTDVDYLTGLLSRQRFLLSADSRLAGDFHGQAIVWFNIDNFKVYNNTFGFSRGSDILRELASALCSTFRGDLISRFSDDHFVLLTTWENLEENIDASQKALRRLHKEAGLRLRAGIYFPSEGDNASLACDRAKLACDSIRRNNCASFCVYREELSQKQQQKKYIIDVLGNAIKQGDIQVLYQPIIRTLTGKICETEALTRWLDPEFGPIPPGAFIPTLEQYRDIHKLDICALQQVCSEYRDRKERGLPLLPTSINLSRLDFELCDIFREVERVAAQYGVPKNMLKIEITESVHGEDQNVLNLGIEKFRQNGYEVWMDDFGSGYSSLNVLKDYSFDTIKFDMKFLSDFGRSEKTRFILSSNLSMTKQIGVQSLAEGVETEEQLTLLKDIGFEKAQGFLFGRPMMLDDLFALPRLKEDCRDIAYYDRLSRVELSNQSAMNRSGRDPVAKVQSMAIFEVENGRFSLLTENDVYRSWMGKDSRVAALRSGELLNSDSALRRQFLAVTENLREGETGKDFYIFLWGNCVRTRITHIASNPRTGTMAILAQHLQVTDLPVLKEGPGGHYETLRKSLEEALGEEVIDLAPDIRLPPWLNLSAP